MAEKSGFDLGHLREMTWPELSRWRDACERLSSAQAKAMDAAIEARRGRRR